ncbi:phage tail terminator-like protein [Litorimonas haliclonae]|uniref:phage tail terminator-like protein n=1 Tax=Litorimonas haliclonae TaxID=2081977 RepID=UPI0039EF0D42
MAELIGAETRVYKRLLDEVETFVGFMAEQEPSVALRVAIPNVGFEPTTYPYLDVQDFSADGAGPTLGPLKNISGVFQVTIIQRRNAGIIDVKELASRLLTVFAKGNRFYDDDLCVTIHQQANERPPIYEDNEVRVPITIPYRAYRR